MSLLGQPHDPRQIVRMLRQDLAATVGLTLPKRVFATIGSHDDASEVLIKVIQFLIFAVFGVLYSIAPKTDAGTAFALAPYTIGLYLALTAVGLAWALTRRLPDWAVYVSIFFDMSILMALIWSFHVQYQQPPSFYLKVPTLLYIFIFIALRALRFRARFVVAAGLMAATGWLAMIAYVVFSDPVDNMVTRDYIHYLTSNSILLGAEFDKVISILMVTAVLALVLRRGRRLLVQAVAEQAAAQDLSRFFDASVATRIRDTDDRIVAGEGVVRQAAVLNVDIRGFTILAATMEPGAVMQLLAEYQSRMVPVIQACNGTIDKFLGDGVMATFGAAAVSDTCAADALRAIDAVIAAAADWAAERRSQGLAPLVINASVAAGPIVFGAVGDANRLEYTVIGAAVNLSAKLEKFNKDLGVAAVTTSDTFDMAVTQGYGPGRPCETRSGRIPGVADEQSIVVLHG